MTKKFYNSEKFQSWFFPILYFVLAISIVVTSCFIFKKLYYLPIVVSGHSMWPTLSGGGTIKIDEQTYSIRYHYGIADVHENTVNDLKRFDVVVTYYPADWGTDEDFKIKRVWGFPGETIDLQYDSIEQSYTFTASKAGQPTYTIKSTYVSNFQRTFECRKSNVDQSVEYRYASLYFDVNEFVLPNKVFRTSNHTPEHGTAPSIRQIHKVLDEDEYFVMGDNWQGSTDSYERRDQSKYSKLTKSLMKGRVICYNAYVDFYKSSKETTNLHEIDEVYEF